MPKLAALSGRTALSEPTLRRVLAANFYLGKGENAAAVAALAGRKDVAETLRLEALELLSQWAKPSSHDHILGSWRPLAPRSPEIASSALRSSLGSILVGSDLV